MVEKQKIIVGIIQEGKSQREIAKELGVSRNTIRKYINEYYEARKEIEGNNLKDIDKQELIEEIINKPKYIRENSYKPKMKNEIEKFVKEKLKVNEEREKMGLRKQKMKITDIYEELKEKQYDISYSSIRRYIREIQDVKKEAFVRQVYEPGDIVEFDWGDIKLIIDGKMKKIQGAVFVLPYSGHYFSQLYYRQNTESFIQSHVDYFEHIGGVTRQIVYDNMKVAVKRLTGGEKEPTDALLKLSTYYVFKPRFCNVRKPNEKGHVERGVEIIKRKVFSHKIDFETLEDAQLYLNNRLIELNKKKEIKYNEEKALFGIKLHKLEIGDMRTCKVDKYSTIVIENNHYSVPEEYSQKAVSVKLYPKRLMVYDMKTNKVVARHERCYGFVQWKMNIEHYLQRLRKKPGAIAGSAALDQANKVLKNIYINHFTKKEKDFIDLLQFMFRENISVVKIKGIINELVRNGHREITKDKILMICQRKQYTKIKESSIEQISREQLKQLSEMVV